MSDEPTVVKSPVLYENHYTWFVLVSALDIMLTWLVLHAGGREANAIADAGGIGEPATVPTAVPSTQPQYCGTVAPISRCRSKDPSPRFASAQDGSTTVCP